MYGDRVALHFARQMKKERLAYGWSLAELGRRTGINPSHLGRIESGRRPPTMEIAIALDKVFPGRRGWFADWLSDSEQWPEIPAAFRHWPDYEDRSKTIRTWNPGIFGGLTQCEDYSRALIRVHPRVNAEVMAARLEARKERQQRVLDREKNPPHVWVIIDELAFYRRVGSPEIMATQMRHLADLAAKPNVTLTVMPAVEHPANASGFVLTDDAAWCEHQVSGGVYTAPADVADLAERFDLLRAECYRASESLTFINEMAEIWASGVNPLTQMATVVTASKSARGASPLTRTATAASA